MRLLFDLKNAEVIPNCMTEQKKSARNRSKIDDLWDDGFFEVETARRIDRFGNIAHVWSAYEARTDPADAEPERRVINSIQLFRDPDKGWRIVAMLWMARQVPRT